MLRVLCMKQALYLLNIGKVLCYKTADEKYVKITHDSSLWVLKPTNFIYMVE